MRTRASLLLLSFGMLGTTGAAAQTVSQDSAYMAGFSWRNIGPANMTGRVTDVEGLPSPSKTFYVASAAGGVWKTTNNGTTFRPMLDDQRVVSMGDLAIAPSDTLQIWAGSGEEDSRNSISPGGGIFKSSDGGKTWKMMGLEKTQAIGRIVVHPKNPDIVYVAALGAPWNTNAERGLYKTTDGGRTWTLSKFISDRAGFVDVAMDPRDPNTLYAASWERIRGPYYLQSGGPGSALWKTTDAGKTWTEIKGGGFPTTTKGRIGIAIARSQPKVVYALVEADSLDGKRLSGLYRSADGGRTWEHRNENNVRPFYYSQVRVSPTDPDHVFWSSTPVNFSRDGGKTVGAATQGLHVDHHAMWWDPADPNRFVVGNDGGIGITYDAGGNYIYPQTLPISQFYAVSYDMAMPYNVCGGLQDNGTWCGPSRRANGVITNAMWATVNGGDGFVTAQDPRDPNLVYAESQGGNMARVNLATGERKSLRPDGWRQKTLPLRDSLATIELDSALAASAAGRARADALRARIAADSAVYDMRYNWNTPFLLSPHDPNVFYAGSNRVLKSMARGEKMQAISPDLSYADTMKIRISTSATGGVTRDVTGAETYGTIVALTESPVAKGTLLAGTDDGRVWMTRNDGKDWEELTSRFGGVPRHTYVSRVEASSHEANTFYVSFDGHRTGDYTPYIFMTTDGGKSFRSITNGLPSGGPDFVHVVREDPTNRNLLFAGTDVGAYVSTDRGASWRRFMEDLPTVPVHDLRIHPRDRELIAATHGRGIWVADIAPLQQASAGTLAADEPTLFAPKPALQYGDRFIGGESTGHMTFRGQNSPYGAEITYFVPRGAAPAPAQRMTADAPQPNGAAADTSATASSGGRGLPADAAGPRGARGGRGPQAQIIVLNAQGDTVQTLTGAARPGMHRVYWNLRKRPERKLLSPAERWDSIEGAKRLRTAADTMIAQGKDRVLVDSAVAMLENPDRSVLARSFGGGGGSGAAPGPTASTFNDRPGETYPLPGTRPAAAARPAGAATGEAGGAGAAAADAERQAAIADIARDLARQTRMGRGGFGGGPDLADAGDYTVVLRIGEKEQRQPLRILRATGYGADDAPDGGGALEEEDYRP